MIVIGFVLSPLGLLRLAPICPSRVGIADAEDQVWRESRRFTLHVLRDFGMGRSSVEAYVVTELHDFLEATEVNKTTHLL